jgi:enoyl-CoA hydratase/carnithine racemase
MTDNTSVLLEKRGQAFWITIKRPDKRDAINGDLIAGIAEGYRTAHDDDEVRVIVLTGAGNKAFCAGADLQNREPRFRVILPSRMSTTPICCGYRKAPSSRQLHALALALHDADKGRLLTRPLSRLITSTRAT